MLARRKRLGLVAVVLVMGALIGEVRCAEKKGGEAAQVTCGSVIALQGNKVGTQVACQEVAYGGHGSGQMACTGVTSVADLSRYFTVKGVQGEECLQGTPVTKGMKIRLQNKATGRWLHSHKFRSMLSKSQEVSCFGGPGESDDSDVWKVTWSGGGKFWSNGDKVNLQHDITGVYLAAMSGQYPQPLTGQREIAGARTKVVETFFSAAEGIYFPPRTHQAPESKEGAPKGHSEL
ncbi:hypothetical protein HOP50_02g12830 [Chloropicon primus]|nr:hypothetical protein A3770_02p12970 [Chloropicon primus]UPQ97986.1 hypothetical protein HOP50_02g12830 [Chloropicon primus]|eukprot:QDZ18779.1 hypothetical protein A3770_02p12970 [Chloropicon primus]